MAMPIGYKQRQMLDFCKRYPGHHYVPCDAESVRIARSLEKRGLLHITDWGMTDHRGRSVLVAQYLERRAPEDCQSRPAAARIHS
jgi:hypothetical protein